MFDNVNYFLRLTMDTNHTDSPASTTITGKFYLSLLGFLLNAKQHLIAVSNDFGLTNIQAATLLLLDDARSCPMKSLGQLFHCDASNVTGIVDGLERKGLVERRNDPRDRRIKTIHICPAGKQLQAHILDALSHDTDFLFDALSPDETKQFVRLVEKLNAHKKPA
jgi:DNA-binding MarR family transcriptional regulator